MKGTKIFMDILINIFWMFMLYLTVAISSILDRKIFMESKFRKHFMYICTFLAMVLQVQTLNIYIMIFNVPMITIIQYLIKKNFE